MIWRRMWFRIDWHPEFMSNRLSIDREWELCYFKHHQILLKDLKLIFYPYPYLYFLIVILFN